MNPCPAYLAAALYERRCQPTVYGVAEFANVTQQTAAKYLRSYQRGAIQQSDWQCQRCHRSLNSVRRHSGQLCRDCHAQLQARGEHWCSYCRRAVETREMRYCSNNRICLRCQPRQLQATCMEAIMERVETGEAFHYAELAERLGYSVARINTALARLRKEKRIQTAMRSDRRVVIVKKDYAK
jgi:hypothetical protein